MPPPPRSGERPQSPGGFGQPHQLYQALKAQLAHDVPDDVLWDDDEEHLHSLPANAKELRAEMEREQLVQRLERRLGLEDHEAPSGSGEAPGPSAFGGWDGPAARRGAAAQARGRGSRPGPLVRRLRCGGWAADGPAATPAQAAPPRC